MVMVSLISRSCRVSMTISEACCGDTHEANDVDIRIDIAQG